MSYNFGRINDLAYQAWINSKNHGFHEDYNHSNVRHQLSLIAMIVSECGEAVEAIRKGDNKNLSEELADIVIRVFEFAQHANINLEQAIVNKMEFNESRPFKHGGKLA